MPLRINPPPGWRVKRSHHAKTGAATADHDLDSVPEPGTAALVALGLAVLAARPQGASWSTRNGVIRVKKSKGGADEKAA